MPTIFTRIINGEIPCHKIAEDENFFAFLDIMPLAPGHVLVVPKKQIDYIFDIDDDLLSGILPFAKKIAEAMEKVIPCERIGISVIGLEVPHAHMHLIPLRTMDDINFSRPKLKMSEKELAEIAAKIVAQL
ncbi:MAG: HIT family protein [Chitinophagales bacterium]|jgi:histidine triad (HIT) family protein|nr:HIT family protein [Bacteroidota bacterium]MBP8916004.1 HIT family protein [Chitinophagales bacterium]MBP9220774.1 HIT family protein [Chitinophagales bacterium]MBP9796139.1 HIT family protein [Chitinophagales bacterium]